MKQKIGQVQYKLLSRFYGVEEFIDYAVPLFHQIDQLSRIDDDLSIIRVILDLDIWYSYFYYRECEKRWNPFIEPFSEFIKRTNSNYIFARYLPDKQYKDETILAFIQ